MRVAFTVGSLDAAADWTTLEQELGDGHPEVVRNTIRHLKILGAKSYVLEDPYIDRDYSADYLEFYARTFRTHARHCRRAHFFSKDVSPLVSASLSTASGYRRHIAGGNASDNLKDALLDLHLPHFNWITEIFTVDSNNHVSAGMRRMYGHTIIDATSTGKGRDAILMLHLPGLVFTNSVDPEPDEPQQQLSIIESDDLYNCREKRLD